MAKRILVVEDDQALRELYFEVLKNQGYEVESVADGETALEKLKNGGYDCVLLDYKLPHMNGIEVLQKLKDEFPAVTNGSILLLTNMGDDTIIADAISLGAKGYLIKADFTPDKLVEEIRRHLAS